MKQIQKKQGDGGGVFFWGGAFRLEQGSSVFCPFVHIIWASRQIIQAYITALYGFVNDDQVRMEQIMK